MFTVLANKQILNIGLSPNNCFDGFNLPLFGVGSYAIVPSSDPIDILAEDDDQRCRMLKD